MRVRNSRRLAMILAWVLRSSTNLAPPPEISLVGMSIPASQKCVVKRWPHSARKQKQKLSYWLHKKLHERKDCGHYYAAQEALARAEPYYSKSLCGVNDTRTRGGDLDCSREFDARDCRGARGQRTDCRIPREQHHVQDRCALTQSDRGVGGRKRVGIPYYVTYTGRFFAMRRSP